MGAGAQGQGALVRDGLGGPGDLAPELEAARELEPFRVGGSVGVVSAAAGPGAGRAVERFLYGLGDPRELGAREGRVAGAFLGGFGEEAGHEAREGLGDRGVLGGGGGS